MNLPNFGPEHYDRAYKGAYNVARYRWLYEKMYEAAGDPTSVLDLGSGLGNVLGCWPAPVPKVRIGFDWSEVAVSKAKAEYPDCRYVCIDFESLMAGCPSVRYDCVMMCEVLEHITFDADLWAWAKTVVGSGGCAVASVPWMNRVSGRAHTAIRYNRTVARERFGEDIEFMTDHDDSFLVFRWTNR